MKATVLAPCWSIPLASFISDTSHYWIMRPNGCKPMSSGALSRVADAAEFNRPIFVTYASDALDSGLLRLALDALNGIIETNRP